MKPIKIAHIATIDMSVRFLLLNQLLRLKAEGYEVHAVCRDGQWVEEIESFGIPVHIIPMRREPSPFHDLFTLWNLIKLFRREGFHIVSTHTPKAGLLGPVAAQLAGVPIVIHTVHGFLFHDNVPRLERWFFMAVEKFTATFADYLFSQSSEDIDAAVKYKICKADKILYIGNGIDVVKFSRNNLQIEPKKKREEVGLKEDELVVGIVARLVYEKGYLEFFQAAAELAGQFDNVRFLVVGPVETDQKDAVNLDIVKELGIEDKVIFLGMRRDMPELYSIMEVFVLPTYREGVPRGLMEASAMEVPVVATNIRGCREVVSDGETGLLVPVRDSQALATAVTMLLQDEQKRIQIGKAGRKRIVAHFSDEIVCERIVQLYKQLIERSIRKNG